MLSPNCARMKLNSPTCTRVKPVCIAVLSGCPERSTPSEAKMICPKITKRLITVIGSQYLPSNAGSIIIPTEVKKMAPNMFLIGLMSRSTRSASRVSARMLPMTKAPNAALKPAPIANSTMPRQSPSDMMVIVSSLR